MTSTLRSGPKSTATTHSASTRRRARLAGVLVVTLGILTGITGAIEVSRADSASAVGVGTDKYDDQRAQKEREAAATKKAKEELDAELEGSEAALTQAALDLEATTARLPQAQAELATAQETLASAQREATIIAGRLQDAKDQEATITQTIASDSARGDTVRQSLGEMARQAYRGGAELSSLGVALGAQSTDEFIAQYGAVSSALRTQARSLDALQQVEAENRNSQARLSAVRDRIAELKAEADAKVVEADKARADAAAREAEITTLIATQTAQKASIEQLRTAQLAKDAELDALAAQQTSELNDIIAKQRAEQAAAGKPATPSGSVSGALFGNPTSTVPIYVTSPFGWRLHPVLHYYRLHAGIDLRAYCNTPIYAGRAGTVEWAKRKSGYGNQVMIDHGFVNGNSLMSSYNHLVRYVVSTGQSVSSGQLIGYSGTEGTSTGCHLHFEVYVNGAVTDPKPLLGL